MSGWRTLLLQGLAEHLAADSVGSWTTDGAYPADATAIVVGSLPQRPDTAIALTTYDGQDDTAAADSTQWVQVRTRTAGTDPRSTEDLADAVFDSLQGLGPHTLPTGVRITVGPTSVSSAPLGQDGNGRYERVDNYRVIAHRPSSHRF